MAKNKDTAFNDFLADLKAINPGIEEILKDEKVSAKLRDGVLARSDYSSKMDELTTQREAFASEVEQARQKIEGWQRWYGDVTTQVAGVQNQLKAYEAAYGPLQTDGQVKAAAKHLGLSKDEVSGLLEERMNQRDIAALKFADDLTDIKIDYRDRFKERLDTEAVFKLAGVRGTDLNTAYKEYISERVEEARTKDIEARIEAARKEAVAEFASQHKLPVVPSQSDLTPHVLDAKDIPATSRDRVAAAVAATMAARSGR
jgi:DNA repair exonuclease SbcCD ATPase subunit